MRLILESLTESCHRFRYDMSSLALDGPKHVHVIEFPYTNASDGLNLPIFLDP